VNEHQREQAISRVAGFLRLNYPCDCTPLCTDPNLNEAEAIVDIVTKVIEGEGRD
jgi:ribulose 1,5-bisphosphate synthetase/thiazole synthase